MKRYINKWVNNQVNRYLSFPAKTLTSKYGEKPQCTPSAVSIRLPPLPICVYVYVHRRVGGGWVELL